MLKSRDLLARTLRAPDAITRFSMSEWDILVVTPLEYCASSADTNDIAWLGDSTSRREVQRSPGI